MAPEMGSELPFLRNEWVYCKEPSSAEDDTLRRMTTLGMGPASSSRSRRSTRGCARFHLGCYYDQRLSSPMLRASPCAQLAHFPARIIRVLDLFASDQAPLRRCISHSHSATRLALSLASSSRPARAHSAMALAHAHGCRFKPCHFESVAHRLSLRHRWSLIPPLVALARTHCQKTTARLLNWRLRALIESHRFAPLHRVLHDFARNNVRPTRRTFHLLISGHLRNNDLHSAKRSLLSMQSAGFPVDPSTQAVILTAYRSLGFDPDVHARALDALPHLDPRTGTRVLNAIIQHALDVGDEPTAAQHLSRMMASTSRGTTAKPDGDPVICPDAATFTIFINHLTNHRQFHRVHDLLNRILQSRVKPDPGLVAALIRAYSLSGRDDIAVSMLAAMLGSDPDARHVLALLPIKVVPQLPLDVKDVDLTVHAFNAILPRVMQVHGLRGANSIFRIMRARSIPSNAATIQVFLNYLDRVQHIKTSRLTQVLRTMSRKLHGPNIRHLNLILRNALRRDKHRIHGTGWNVTAAKFSSKRRCAPSSTENNTILSSECFDLPDSHPPHHAIRPAILAISRKGVKSDRATFAMWLRHEGLADPTLDTAKSVFRYMIDKGIHPNRRHFASLVDGFARAGDMCAAQQVIRSAREAGFEPDVVMWTMLISGYGRKGDPALAMKTFRSMIAAGISPDVAAIDALAHAYFAVGAYLAARKVLLELWPRVKPFPDELRNAPLKQLARVFRQSEKPCTAWNQSLSPEQQRSFDRNLCQILREWKEI